jgi:hypothetical protein
MTENARTLAIVLLLSAFLFSCADNINPDITGGSGTNTGGNTTNTGIVGKWKLTGITTNIDTKTYTATTNQIIAGLVQDSINTKTTISDGLLIDPAGIIVVLTKSFNFEFKSDSTFSTSTGSGKWSLSADKSVLTITANNKKSTFALMQNTSGALQLGLQKFTRKSENDSYSPSTSLYSFDALYGKYGVYGASVAPEIAIKSMLSYQGFLNYTKQ